jgi:tRNA nucleotidyltransferase (CCA-adding enzyme)
MLRSGVAESTVRIEIPEGLKRLLDSLREAGGRPYLVGGAVRDALLGRPTKDFDVEVYGLGAERLRLVAAGLGSVDEVGAAFSGGD